MAGNTKVKKLLIILCETPFHSDKVDLSIKIAETTIKNNHAASIFLFMDGVYNMISSQDGEPFKIKSISQRLQDLLDMGVDIYCCKLCKILRGITDDMISPYIQASGIAELNDLIDDADAVISFTG